jgi:hypothetical protein
MKILTYIFKLSLNRRQFATFRRFFWRFTQFKTKSGIHPLLNG